MRGNCWEGGGAPVYWPWVQVVRELVRTAQANGSHVTRVARILPESGERLTRVTPSPASLLAESNLERFDLFLAFGAILRDAAEKRALVVALEDLHAADRSSLLLLSFLARETRDSRLLLVGTYRDLEVQGTPLAESLDRLAVEGARLALQGLARDGVTDIVERTAGCRPSAAAIAAIHEATAGNPLFVRELVRLLVSEGRLEAAGRAPGGAALPIPAGIREAVHRRLALLSAECRDLLSAASVFGRECELSALSEVVDVGRDRMLSLLDEAIRAGMIVEVTSLPGRFVFTHGQVRETLHADLAYARRVELHRRIGEALERLYAANLEPHLDELALHFWHAAAAGNAEKAIDYEVRAGERASAALAYDEAAASYERALALLEHAPSSEERRAGALLSIGEARGRAGNPEAARESFRRAAGLCRRLGDSRGLARAALGLGAGGFGGVWAIARTEQEDLVPLLEEAAAGLRASDEVLRAKVTARLATALHYSPAGERREASSREAVEVARRTQDREALAFALSARHYALCGPDRVSEGLALAEEIVELAEQAGDRELALEGRAWRIVDLVVLAEPSRAAQEIEIYAQLAKELRQPFWLWYGVMWKGVCATLTGRFSEAEKLAADALEIGRRAQEENAAHTYGVQMFLILWLRGELEDAIGLAERMVARYPAYFVGWKYSLALLYAESGRSAEARRELDPLADAGDLRAFHAGFALLFGALLSETCALLGDAGWAASLYESLSPFARLFVIGGHDLCECYGSVSHYLGRLAATMDRREAAIAHFEDALAMHTRTGARPFAARSAYECARALLAGGRDADRERASRLLADAVAIARELGMKRLAAQTEALMNDAPAGAKAEANDAAIPPSPALEALFRREGRYWTIAFRGETVRLKNSLGLCYVAELLRRSGERVHLKELLDAVGTREDAAGSSSRASTLGDAGEVLDAKARSAYRNRLRELEEELAEAKGAADAERASRLEDEKELLAREIAGALGLGGRPRRAASGIERARVSVTKAIRAAIARIGAASPSLGHHLATTVRTGTFCSYVPDPGRPPSWRL